MTRILLVAFALVCLTGCSEPFVVFPGGDLSGETKTPPDDWTELAAAETFQIETRPGDPYSANIWAVGIDGDAYIGTGPDGTTWSEHIEEDPRVVLRVGEALYSLLAHPVTETEEQRRVAAAYAEKYDLDPDENWLMDARVFRLDRR